MKPKWDVADPASPGRWLDIVTFGCLGLLVLATACASVVFLLGISGTI